MVTEGEKGPPPSFAEALRFWIKLGFISFGGPAGQIAIMHAELVERRGWISEERFLRALNLCMLLPGPEAQQLAIYIGWTLHGVRGGLTAGTLFVLPAAVLLWGLSWLYVVGGSLPWMAAVLWGLKPAVIAIVAASLWRIGARALKTWRMRAVAAGAFAALAWIGLPFPAVVLGAGLLGWLWTKDEASSAMTAPEKTEARNWPRTLRRALAGVGLWLSPTLLAGWRLGWDSAICQQGVFFSKAALVTFGGAYAVLPYVAQQAVGHYGWLETHQMIDGLGLAETTPGPLIIVLEFVGFVGAWRHPGTLEPLLAGTLGAGLTVWATFAPCFLFIFLCAPYAETLQRNRRLAGAFSTVTAAVVGVIASLAAWFTAHVWQPDGIDGGTDWLSVALSAAAFCALRWGRWNVVAVIAGCGAVGLARMALAS
jgi:chromate transporter